MSYQAVSWALYHSPTIHTSAGRPDTTARMVLAVLGEHADDRGANARPSVLRIRWATGYDERTIQRALQRLEKAGLIARSGATREGVTRWRLSLHIVRSDEEWYAFEAEADRARQVETERRLARRGRTTRVDVSGTQNPGHIESDVSADDLVRDAESGSPGRRIPDAGILRPSVRDATPPEPPMNLPEPPGQPPTGAAAGPRPPATRRSSFVGSTDRTTPSPSGPHDQDQGQEGRLTTARAGAGHSPA